MNPEESIEFLEEMSSVYKDDTPSRNIHNRVFLERRWQAAKIAVCGITKKNYKQALTEVEALLDTDNEKDKKLLNMLVDKIQVYEKENFS